MVHSQQPYVYSFIMQFGINSK
uniref:Uncharacterized protein n=1 Tax=Rhizophora mucronata TaxID=61149 RepID=A0A2P2NA52_RHIMU